MEFGFTREEQEVITQVRDLIKKEVTPEVVAETEELGHAYGGPRARKVIQKFGSRGWLTPSWPTEYGGLGSSEMLSYMIRDEMAYAGLPLWYVGAYNAGPIILRYGSEEMKKRFLPPIARGEIEFALGYTEPQAGSDLAAVSIKAEDKGDYFLVNGQKTFNTHAHLAEYHWLAARTEFEGPRHRGISLMIVDLKSPGITIRPLITMAGWRTNEVYYDNVMVPRENLVGEINRGFYYIMSALDFERMFPPGAYRRLFESIVEYAKNTNTHGRPLSKDPLIRQKLAEISVGLEVARLLYYRLAYMLDQGRIPNYESSMEKTFVTELAQEICNTGMQVLGLRGQLRKDDPTAPLGGKVEFYYRSSVVETIFAGTSEIQRNIIAERGLALPRG
jgi:alkylation response protein AidB-like acyl-CoA dehydrogenase